MIPDSKKPTGIGLSLWPDLDPHQTWVCLRLRCGVRPAGCHRGGQVPAIEGRWSLQSPGICASHLLKWPGDPHWTRLDQLSPRTPRSRGSGDPCQGQNTEVWNPGLAHESRHFCQVYWNNRLECCKRLQSVLNAKLSALVPLNSG